jgi:hypothetical protein
MGGNKTNDLSTATQVRARIEGVIMRIVIRIFLLVTGVLSSSCKDQGDPVSTLPPSDTIVMVDALSGLNLPFDPARIASSRVSGDVLLLTVEYVGGCKQHELRLIGLRAFLKSNPPQADIFLSHDAHSDRCEALIEEQRRFGLAPLRQVLRQAFGRGAVLLRVHEPGMSEPLRPLLQFEF